MQTKHNMSTNFNFVMYYTSHLVTFIYCILYITIYR